MATSEKVIEMSNRLKSIKSSDNPEVNHIIAGTDDIYDDNKGKKQSQINAETDATLAEHTSTINGLNSQNYVTVTATDHTTAATDVLPATGSADTIYRVGSWDGTQYDETCYSEYSWNGSAYVHIDTKTQIGEVFDISAYHASGGTLAKYADLSAALGTNGANIPESLRKGGMSVKFVQSSDNKYVQYRLMSDSFNTTVANWQGVDDEPTAGSDNLVKSSGVFNHIYNKIPFSSSAGIVNALNGTTQNTPTSRRKTDFIDISGINSIIYTRAFTDSTEQKVYGLAFYDSEKNYISGIQEPYNRPSEGYELFKVTVPDNAIFARFTYWANEKDGLFFFTDGDKDDIAKILYISKYDTDNKISSAIEKIMGYEVGKKVSTTPEIVKDDAFGLSKPILINSTDSVKWAYPGAELRSCALGICDADGNLIGGWFNNTTVDERIITDWSGETQLQSFYIRASFLLDNANNSYIAIKRQGETEFTKVFEGVNIQKIHELIENYEIIFPIDISKYPTSSWFINNQGNWAQSGTNVLIPITAGKKYKVTANPNYDVSFSVLASDSYPSQTGPAEFATGYSGRIELLPGESRIFTAPQDAKTMLTRLVQGDGDNCTPAVFTEIDLDYINSISDDNTLLKATFNSSFNKEDVSVKRREFCALMEGKDAVESFLFFTDPHLSSASRYETITELVRDKYISALQKYYNSLPLDNCICGGDLVNYVDDNAIGCDELGYFDGYMRKLFKNYRPCMGNHDFAPYRIVDRQLRDYPLTHKDVRNIWFREEGETYYSFDGVNTKFYVMDSGASFAKTMTNVKYPDINNIRWAQVDWFANKLLTDDAENSAIVMHMYSNGRPASNSSPATWYDDNPSDYSQGFFYFSKNIREVAIAYNNRTSITKNGITYDFSQVSGKVLFFLCGHSHFDFVDTSMELPVICCTNLEGGVWNPAIGTEVNALIPTFDNILVDITNNVFYAVRVGAGANRIIELSVKNVSVGSTLSLTTKLAGTITWESRNTSIANVANGVVSGVSAGIAEILATNENGELEQWCIKVS